MSLGGCGRELEAVRELVELPLMHPGVCMSIYFDQLHMCMYMLITYDMMP